ncbi:uncharacterized protein LOC128554639, partial [Mercenaria mercenaria]|uniref:uncharacterized protein LOC128554639 n=1 Tax=Mercenaria mercenaria TaxID=6596 RepID=UPI00234F4BFE
MNKNKNKNRAFYRKSDTHGEERKNDTFVKAITILQESSSSVQILPHIEYIFKFFGDSLLLYESGQVQVFTQLSTTLSDKLTYFARQSLPRLKLENIGSWSQLHECFLIYKLNDGDTIVLPQVSQTTYFFEQLKENISVVYVKLDDILEENNTIVKCLPSEILHRHNYSESSNYFTWKDAFCTTTRKISLKSLSKVRTPTFDSSSIVFPLSGEFQMTENFPQQVTEEQNDEGRSVFAFSNGQSLPVTSDQASSLAIGGNSLSRYHGHNASSGNEIAHASNLMHFSRNQSNTVQRPRHPDFIEYNDRLRSYARWTRRSPDPNTLSRAGFFFT